MESFVIEGGHPLKGSITPQGAKNEALQILCAVLLSPEKITIHNIPDIIDVNKLILLLGKLGVKVEKLAKGSYTFQSDEINLDYLETEAFKVDGRGLRGSIMIVGPLLARFGKGYIPKPGGDKIGRRRLDTHFEGFIKLGANFRYNREDHFYGVEAESLNGTKFRWSNMELANIELLHILDKHNCHNTAYQDVMGWFCHYRKLTNDSEKLYSETTINQRSFVLKSITKNMIRKR